MKPTRAHVFQLKNNCVLSRLVSLDVKYLATSGTCCRMVTNASCGSDGVKGSNPKAGTNATHY